MISGKAKARRLRMVPGDKVRPISDRVKESVFNIIGANIEESCFLDLFAGTGSVGIEALSRDADRVYFIDINGRAIETVYQNLELTGLEERAEVYRQDAFEFLAGDPEESFDFVYVAPPQYAGIWKKAVTNLDSKLEWLNPDAWVIAQIHPQEYEELKLNNLAEFDQRRYGNTLLVFYEYPGE